MGLFDFLKKKPQEPVVQQTEEHVVEVEGMGSFTVTAE